MLLIIGGWVVCPRGRLATEIDSTQTYTWPEIFDFWRETKMPAGRRRRGGAPRRAATGGHVAYGSNGSGWTMIHDHTIGGVMKHEEVEAVQFVVPTNTLLLHSIGKIQ